MISTARHVTLMSLINPVRVVFYFLRDEFNNILTYVFLNHADRNGRALYGVGLRPLACWDCGFESRRGRGCLL